MHSAHWEEWIYKVTHDLSIAGSDIWVDTSYDMLHQVGVETTLCFCRQDWMKAKLLGITTRIKLVNGVTTKNVDVIMLSKC